VWSRWSLSASAAGIARGMPAKTGQIPEVFALFSDSDGPHCPVLAHFAWLFVIDVPRTVSRYPRVRLSCSEPS
jgi:hypothetical protein